VLAGTAAIMALAGSVVARMSGDPYWTIILLAVAGGCIGFLVFNLPPAKTFMGDCGSLYLGYMFGLAIYRLGFLASRPTRKCVWMAAYHGCARLRYSVCNCAPNSRSFRGLIRRSTSHIR